MSDAGNCIAMIDAFMALAVKLAGIKMDYAIHLIINLLSKDKANFG